MPYFGSKQSLADWIASMLPAHEHYVEPYGGSLAVLLAKPPSRMETANDLDGRLANFWRILRDQPEELARVCALTPHSRTEYTNALQHIDVETDPVERARLAWVILHQGRGRRFDGHEGWRHTVGRTTAGGSDKRVAAGISRAVDLIAPAAERMRTVTLECLPALDLIGKYGAHSNVLLFVDPPYLGSTRPGPRRYGLEMADPHQHRELASALAGCRSAVVLSGYPSPLYDELYASWHREQRTAVTGNGRLGKQDRTEVLWSNRPLGAQTALDLGATA
jgi:DNA adenine methylase